MHIEASKNQNFSVDYTTKSGKRLSLNMFDRQNVHYSSDEKGKSLSFVREYGFNFSFEGSRLSALELDEIKNAMKDVKDLLQDFLQNSKLKELNPKSIIENAMKISHLLPKPSDENHQNAIMNHLVNQFDAQLNRNKTSNANQNIKMLQDGKKLIDEIFHQIRKDLKKSHTKSEKNSAFYA